MNATKISWCDSTWNLVSGCTKIMSGCKNCYAEVMHRRLRAMQSPHYQHEFNTVCCHPDVLDQPLHKRKPQTIFVNSMSDLFHEDVPSDFIDQIMKIVGMCPRHTFLVLTKRAERMRDYYRSYMYSGNLWSGISASTQADLDALLPFLVQTPGAHRLISLEPLLEEVDLNVPCGRREVRGVGELALETGLIDLVIVGGESGKHARPMPLSAARSVRDQCAAARIPFYFKQWGEFEPIGENYQQKEYARAIRTDNWREVHKHILVDPSGKLHDISSPHPPTYHYMKRKVKAGRLLDGVLHDDLPWRK